MGERGEKKRRSPGQEKARKERQPVWGSPMAQSLKSFKQWCLIWNFIWSLFLFWAVLKVFIPYPQTLTEWLYPTAWWSWCFGEWRRRESDQTRHRACWKEHRSHEMTWLLGRQPSVYTTEGTLCLSFIQQSFSENGAWGWNDVKYVGWITHRLSPSQFQSLEERELGSYSSSMG